MEFVFGIDASPTFVGWAQQLADKAWRPLRRPQRKAQRRRAASRVKQAVIERREFRDLRPEVEDVAEIEYRPRKAQGCYRLVILRKRIRATQGQLRLADEIRYFFYVTNIRKRQLGTAGVARENNARCHQENLTSS